MTRTEQIARSIAQITSAWEEAEELGQFAARCELAAEEAEVREEWTERAKLLERAERYRGLQLWALTRAGMDDKN